MPVQPLPAFKLEKGQTLCNVGTIENIETYKINDTQTLIFIDIQDNTWKTKNIAKAVFDSNTLCHIVIT